jgi:Na+-translocating ferredoxin:NAD+ oxidoreductase RNF subunit RnfB
MTPASPPPTVPVTAPTTNQGSIPKDETTVIETDVTPGITENIEAQTKSAITSHARKAAKVYAEMVASGKNPNIGDVLSEAGSMGFILFSLDRKKWTSEFDAALPEGVQKPSWGIR